eukprot:3418741-Amphidinium_carterae.3
MATQCCWFMKRYKAGASSPMTCGFSGPPHCQPGHNTLMASAWPRRSLPNRGANFDAGPALRTCYHCIAWGRARAEACSNNKSSQLHASQLLASQLDSQVTNH